MKLISVILNVFSWITVGLIVLVVLYLLSSSLEILSYKSFLVQSGSMEPAIMTGDIIIIHKSQNYIVNDVITFKDADHRIVTHRIVKVSENNNRTEYSTKGDANRSEDFDSTTYDQIIGKVTFVIPKLGYLVAFSKSIPGLIILILIPTAIFIADELFKIKKNA